MESAGSLPDLLRHCLDPPGVHLIDCPVDYSENDRILNKDLKALSAAASRPAAMPVRPQPA